jgi:hypothetical protein
MWIVECGLMIYVYVSRITFIQRHYLSVNIAPTFLHGGLSAGLKASDVLQ